MKEAPHDKEFLMLRTMGSSHDKEFLLLRTMGSSEFFWNCTRRTLVTLAASISSRSEATSLSGTPLRKGWRGGGVTRTASSPYTSCDVTSWAANSACVRQVCVRVYGVCSFVRVALCTSFVGSVKCYEVKILFVRFYEYDVTEIRLMRQK